MANYFTADQFRSEARTITEARSREYVGETSPSKYAQFDIFLSYNISDQQVVKGIFYYLSKLGYKVYLDCLIDPQLERENCNRDTADLIHNRLKCSKSLIYASSISSANSKWMPWELGVVDGHTGKCFVLPVDDGYKLDFVNKEYLQLYPKLVNVSAYALSMKVQNYYGAISEFKI